MGVAAIRLVAVACLFFARTSPHTDVAVTAASLKQLLAKCNITECSTCAEMALHQAAVGGVHGTAIERLISRNLRSHMNPLSCYMSIR